MNNKLKRVGCLYRVSTTMQATRQEREEADIPTQRTACMRFIEQHPDWVFTKEYVEIGVSGFKNSMSERDKLLEAKDDIACGVIDVLLVFMLDRLGRIEEETPLVVKSFVEMGAEVWSVREGRRKFEDHMDGLINYLTFWQAAGESKKTSERVTNAMTQMAEQGLYTGGRCPYGYKTVETGRLTKKKLPEKTLAIDEDEALIVKKIFYLAIKRGFGSHRIARALNEEGIPTRSGGQWSCASVSNILTNPLYKGTKAYGRTTAKGKSNRQIRLPQEKWTVSETNTNWVIIPEEDWDIVHEQRQKVIERQKAQKEYNDSLPDMVYLRGKLLFIGIAYCRACGSKMITGYSPYRWKTEDGVIHRRDNPVYRCSAKASGKIGCTGKTSYAKDKVDLTVMEEINKFLCNLATIDLSEDISQLRKEMVKAEERRLKALEKRLLEAQNDKKTFEKEVPKSLRGEGQFEPKLLSRLLAENKDKIKALEAELTDAKQLMEKKTIEYDDIVILKKTIPVWSKVFDEATFEEQRIMLSKIIEKVEIGLDGIQVHTRLHMNEFLGLALDAPLFSRAKKGNSLASDLLNSRPDRY